MKLVSSELLQFATVYLDKLPYRHVQGQAVTAISKQLVKRGGDEEALGIAMLRGALKGLRAVQKEKNPICPFCGKRHPVQGMMQKTKGSK